MLKSNFNNNSLYNILIIEDEFINAEFLKQVLINLGFENVDVLTNAADALDYVKANDVDFIFMDINIEGAIDGIMCARLINQYKEIPIIYTTAYSDSQTITEATQTNIYGYLIKPFDEKDIEATCNIILLKLHKEQKVQKILDKKVFAIAKGYIYNIQNNQLINNGIQVKLSKNEAKLLKLLCENINQCVAYKNIKHVIWGEKEIADTTLRDTISRVRKRIPNIDIESWAGSGYCLKEVS